MSTQEEFVERSVESDNFRIELEKLINRFGMENASNTPDFILSRFMRDCLIVFELSVKRRENWYGRHMTPGKIYDCKNGDHNIRKYMIAKDMHAQICFECGTVFFPGGKIEDTEA